MDFSPEEFEEILNIYGVECDEIIQRMNSCVLLLEKDNSNLEIINKLFRDAHSLKGASRMVGFDKIQLIAHRLEDLLELANNEKKVLNKDAISVFYKVLDCLSNAIQMSVERKKEFVDETVEECLHVLDSLISSDSPEGAGQECLEPVKEEMPVKVDFAAQDIENIYAILDKISDFLKNYPTNENKEIVSLLNYFEEISKYFNKKNSYKIKNSLDDAVAKLKFVQMATGFLVDFEVAELETSVDFVRNELAKLITSDECTAPIIESSKNTYKDLVSQLIQILGNFDENPENNIAKIDATLEALLENIKNSSIQVVYREIQNICKNFQKKSITPSGDIIKLLMECVADSVNFFDGSESTTVDIDSIMQRLSIAAQVIDIEVEPETQNLAVVAPKALQEEKPVKAKDFFTNFENVSIKTLRVDTTKLDKLVNQMSELIVSRIKIQDHLKELQEVKHNIEDLMDAQNRLIKLGGFSHNTLFQAEDSNSTSKQNSQDGIGAIKNKFEKIYESFAQDCQYYNQSVDELAEMIKNIRVLPLATIFHQFPRMVRDISIEKNKEIELLISGADTTVDKKIIEEIKSPLVHIIRNSIDHGIETPDVRVKKGKPPTGKIILRAKNLSNKVVIEIQDDGSGVNIEKIKHKALSAGLLTEAELNQLNDEQIMNLIFLPGFSTGESVTEISGRGIGLDVVQSKITQLEGKVSIKSEMGKGATLRIELPVSLATIQAFVVQAGELLFAIPILAVSSVRNVYPKEIFIKDNEKHVILDNSTVKVYVLKELLNPGVVCNFDDRLKLQLIVLEVENERVGIVVDTIEGDFEILQKKFAPPIFKLRFISGITALTSGKICYILNISDIFKYSLNDKTKTLIDSKERIKRLNKIAEQKEQKVVIFDNTDNVNTLNPALSAFFNDYRITNNIEEFLSVIEKNDSAFILFVLNKDYENIFKLIYELKNNENYSSLKLGAVCCNADGEIQKAFMDLHLDSIEFVTEIESDICVYSIKKLLS